MTSNPPSARSSSRRIGRTALMALFIAFLALLLFATIRAIGVRSILDNGPLMDDVWFQVTLLDAYLGIATCYVWIAWKERGLLRRLVWFGLLLVFGNMAVSMYVILQLVRLPPDADVSDVLNRS